MDRTRDEGGGEGGREREGGRGRGAWVVGAMAIIALLAGCLGGDDDDGSDRAVISGDVPAPCDETRRTVAHRAGGVLVDDAPAMFVPCLGKTGVNSREPTIGIGADGTVFHYPAMTGDNTQPSGVSISRDEGATWEISLPTLAGVVPTHPISLDPYFFLDPTTGRIFADDLQSPNCSTFSWSDDGGATWDNSYSGCLITDHQTIFTGPPVLSPTVGYPNIVYRCAISGGALAGSSTTSSCQTSLDGGRTWGPPGGAAFVAPPEGAEIYDGALGHGATDANGRVYLPKGLIGQPFLAWSDDEGLTWARAQIADNGMSDDDGYPAHEAGIAVDAGGNLYYFWVAADRLPYLSISTDSAATWSEPIMVGAPGVNEASLPEIIAGGVGKIAFVYMGTTNGPGSPFDGDYDGATWNAYLAVSLDALAQDPIFLTAPVNDPDRDPMVVGTCGALRCQGVQDFLDVRIGPDGTPWGAFIDACLGEGTECAPETNPNFVTNREGAAGRLWGGPSLWDASDENGPYP